MLAARVFFLASVFNVRTSSDFHARRLEFLAISLPFGWKNTPCFYGLNAARTETFEYGGFAAVEKRLRNEWAHRRMKALFPECSRFVYSTPASGGDGWDSKNAARCG